MTVPVFPLVAAAPPVTAIIGTAPVRCYPSIIPANTDGTPNNTLLPCLTYRTVTGQDESYIDAPGGIGRRRAQVDAWALTFAAAEALANVARTALEDGGRNVAVSENGEDYEPDTKRWRVSRDFEFWVSR